MNETTVIPEIPDYHTNIKEWVQKAPPQELINRQATAVVLYAIGMQEKFAETLYLKGGTLMYLAFESVRRTRDIDFTSSEQPVKLEEDLRAELDASLNTAKIKLAYTGIQLKLQSVKQLPKATGFPDDFTFPALKLKIGFARVSSNSQIKKLNEKQSANTIDIDISFKEEIYTSGNLNLKDVGIRVKSYSSNEVIAEKLRALLQQVSRLDRTKNRRQDIYDVSYLIEHQEPSDEDKRIILETLMNKCETHNVPLSEESFDSEELKLASGKGWETLAMEISGHIPNFEDRYRIVKEFFKSLPWEISNKWIFE